MATKVAPGERNPDGWTPIVQHGVEFVPKLYQARSEPVQKITRKRKAVEVETAKSESDDHQSEKGDETEDNNQHPPKRRIRGRGGHRNNFEPYQPPEPPISTHRGRGGARSRGRGRGRGGPASGRTERRFSNVSQNEIASSSYRVADETIVEESKVAPEQSPVVSSALTDMIRQPDPRFDDDHTKSITEIKPFPPLPTIHDEPEPRDIERTSLLSKTRSKLPHRYWSMDDVENPGCVASRSSNPLARGLATLATYSRTITNPKSWDRGVIWREGVVQPISLLPA
ncbi:hypothetical protein N7528_005156 [Penicillium herquei]|nr:hypothetical protein N7528_005156 [Penicillium herquei]